MRKKKNSVLGKAAGMAGSYVKRWYAIEGSKINCYDVMPEPNVTLFTVINPYYCYEYNEQVKARLSHVFQNILFFSETKQHGPPVDREGAFKVRLSFI